MVLYDLNRALAGLSIEQRDAIILICGSGFSYDEAAAICGCPIGTIKSRVNRARALVVKLLSTSGGDVDHGPAARVRMAIAPGEAASGHGPAAQHDLGP